MRPSGATKVSSRMPDRKSTRLNSSHTVIYTLSLHDALPIWRTFVPFEKISPDLIDATIASEDATFWSHEGVEPYARSEEHTSELQSHSDLHSFPTRRSSDLADVRSLREDLARLDRRHHRLGGCDLLEPRRCRAVC